MAESSQFAVVWTNPAVKDLDDLCDWISVDNPSAAERLTSQIKRRVYELAAVPRTGAAYFLIEAIEVRQIVVRPYRILYQISDAERTLTILRVWHGSRREPSPSELGLPDR